MQNIVYESVVTKGSCDKNKVQKKFVGDLFLSPSPEGGRKEWKKVICDTYSTQTEILLSSQSTSHIGRNVESEYISIPGMMRIIFATNNFLFLFYHLHDVVFQTVH